MEDMVASLEGKRVLVTGGLGFLGSHLTDELVRSGARITLLVRDIPAHADLSEWHRKGHIVFGNVQDFDLLERILYDYEIEVVFHLAAQALVTVANQYPLETLETNIRGTYNLLEACRRYGKIQALIVASSDKAYGISDVLPYRENFPLQGQHPYDVSKSCADLLSGGYQRSFGMPIGITRCGNLYGPGDMNFDRLIPGTIQWLLDDEEIVLRSDGTFRRDYLFIDDAVAGYLKVAAAVMDNPERFSGAYNLSHGEEYTIMNIVDWLREIAGKPDHPVRIMKTARSEIPYQWLDSGKARELLGWEPGNSVREGLEITYKWYRNLLRG